MGQIGLSVTMDCTFRLKRQEFSNVFHYKFAGPAIDNAEPYLDEVVTILKNLHSTDVSFKWGRVWTSDGTPGENRMLFQKALSGTGVCPTNTNMDRERAFLIQWPAGLSITGKPVYLRKWIHSCGATHLYNPSAGVLQNTAEIMSGDRANIATEANKLRLIGAVDELLLCAASGREHTGPGTVHRFLEHHQLGDQWR